MNELQYDLNLLVEECTEVMQLASKSIRFGLGSYSPYDEKKISNSQKLTQEINDVYAILDLLKEKYGIDTNRNEEMISIKKEKVKYYSTFSRDEGLLR
jgi:NTP pyrophosphatase (non-canonical NTP hydrolase)